VATSDQVTRAGDRGAAGPRFRPALEGLPAYRPGRSRAGAIKLSSNESPYGPLPGVVERAARALEGANRYPDIASTALAEALAARHGVSRDEVVVGCGSVTLCQQIVNAVAGPGDEVAYGWRSFEAYPILVTVAGGSSVQVPLVEQAYDPAGLLASLSERTRLVFICNPNNPTGTVLRRHQLLRVLDAIPPDCLVVLDEAYREYVTDPEVPDALDLMEGRPNLAVLRTFSKAYGLAGLRVGYCVASAEVTTAIRRTQVPFGVSLVAQAAALASLEAPGELARRVAEVVGERRRVQDALLDLGYPVPPSEANFVWLALGERAGDFASGCEARGIIVRPFAGDGVRVTIGTPAENDAFLAAAGNLAE
jgi:histidinol-phosphate aminotransferase